LNSLDTSFAKVEIDSGMATVTLNRPERLNALHPAAHRELSRIFDALPNEASVRAIILTGTGNRAFCAGYDLKDNLESGVMEIASTGFGGLTARSDYPLPLIAAVNGVAYGGGFEMALACDFIVAARSARFALPEPKVGWAALSGGVQRLPQAIGIKRAMDIILTARTVSAEEGFALGLVSEVVADQELPAAARRWARQVVACAPLAIRCSRQVAYATFGDANQSPDVRKFPLIDTMLESADAQEGKRAFAEQRPPVWSGR
jgi:crotonobetainyl-CoA hydratase